MGDLISRDECEYDKLPGLNISTLLAMRESPKHYRHRLKHPRPPTDAMSLGIVAHVAVLEPERFLREYALWQSTDPETGKTRQRRGKAWEQFKTDNDGKIIVRDVEYEQAVRYSRSVRKDPVAMRYLAVGEPEVAMTWDLTESLTTLPCRGRVDWVTEVDGRPCIVDLKTAASATPGAFGRAAARLDYHARLAWYADGYERITGQRPMVRVVVVDKTDVCDVVTYRINEDVLERGRDIYRGLLERLQECEQNGRWPGAGDGDELDLILPAWAAPEAEEEIAIQWDQ